MKPDAPVWEDICITYTTDKETTIEMIAARYGVTVGQLNYRAHKNGWLRPKPDVHPFDKWREKQQTAPAKRDLSSIRRAYEESADTIAEIATRFGVHRSTIKRDAQKYGWKRRDGGHAALIFARAARAAGKAFYTLGLESSRAMLGTLPHRIAILQRLYVVVDARLTGIETVIADSEPLSRADSDRETREIALILKTFEKLLEFSHSLASTADSTGDPKPGTDAAAAASRLADDADRLRNELAQRLAVLGERQRRLAAAPAGEPGPESTS